MFLIIECYKQFRWNWHKFFYDCAKMLITFFSQKFAQTQLISITRWLNGDRSWQSSHDMFAEKWIISLHKHIWHLSANMINKFTLPLHKNAKIIILKWHTKFHNKLLKVKGRNCYRQFLASRDHNIACSEKPIKG